MILAAQNDRVIPHNTMFLKTVAYVAKMGLFGQYEHRYEKYLHGNAIMNSYKVKEDDNEDQLMDTHIYLSSVEQLIARKTYNLLDFLIETGGYLKAFTFGITIMISSCTQFIFFISMIQGLYLAHTGD